MCFNNHLMHEMKNVFVDIFVLMEPNLISHWPKSIQIHVTLIKFERDTLKIKANIEKKNMFLEL